MEEPLSLYEKDVDAQGHVCVVLHYVIGQRDGVGTWNVFSILSCGFPFKCRQIGAVYGKGPFCVVGGYGAIVDQPLGKYLLKKPFRGSSKLLV